MKYKSILFSPWLLQSPDETTKARVLILALYSSSLHVLHGAWRMSLRYNLKGPPDVGSQDKQMVF